MTFENHCFCFYYSGIIPGFFFPFSLLVTPLRFAISGVSSFALLVSCVASFVHARPQILYVAMTLGIISTLGTRKVGQGGCRNGMFTSGSRSLKAIIQAKVKSWDSHDLSTLLTLCFFLAIVIRAFRLLNPWQFFEMFHAELTFLLRGKRRRENV
jgi:hypothetical protein